MLTLLILPIWAQALMTVGGAVVAALTLRWLSHHKRISPKLGRAREVANLMRQPTTTFVAMTLALSGVEVIGELNRAGLDAGREAGVLERLHRDALAYGGAAAQEFSAALTVYVRSVIKDEWPHMQETEESPQTKAHFEDLLALSTRMRAADPREQMWLNDIVTQLNVAADLRRVRIARAKAAMPWIFYLVAGGGSLVLISMAALSPPGRGSAVIVTSYATVIGLALLLVVSLDLPFSGGLGIGPGEFQLILKMIEARGP